MYVAQAAPGGGSKVRPVHKELLHNELLKLNEDADAKKLKEEAEESSEEEESSQEEVDEMAALIVSADCLYISATCCCF